MLSFESEKKLNCLLLTIGQGEEDLESSRQRLCLISDLTTRSCFDRLDRLQKKKLTPDSFVNFFRDNGVYHVSYDESLELIKFFSAGQQLLNYDDFIQIILPCEHNQLRAQTISRPSGKVGPNEYLPTDIEMCMADIFEREINL